MKATKCLLVLREKLQCVVAINKSLCNSSWLVRRSLLVLPCSARELLKFRFMKNNHVMILSCTSFKLWESVDLRVNRLHVHVFDASTSDKRTKCCSACPKGFSMSTAHFLCICCRTEPETWQCLKIGKIFTSRLHSVWLVYWFANSAIHFSTGWTWTTVASSKSHLGSIWQRKDRQERQLLQIRKYQSEIQCNMAFARRTEWQGEVLALQV